MKHTHVLDEVTWKPVVGWDCKGLARSNLGIAVITKSRAIAADHWAFRNRRGCQGKQVVSIKGIRLDDSVTCLVQEELLESFDMLSVQIGDYQSPMPT